MTIDIWEKVLKYIIMKMLTDLYRLSKQQKWVSVRYLCLLCRGWDKKAQVGHLQVRRCQQRHAVIALRRELPRRTCSQTAASVPLSASRSVCVSVYTDTHTHTHTHTRTRADRLWQTQMKWTATTETHSAQKSAWLLAISKCAQQNMTKHVIFVVFSATMIALWHLF